MHKTKQIIAVSAVLLLMGILLAQPIKGLVDKEADAQPTAGVVDNAEAANQVNLETVSAIAKQGLNASLVKQIEDLETQLSESNDPSARMSVLKQLATRWDDVEKKAPLGFVSEAIAELDPSFKNWETAGDAFSSAYENLQDTMVAPVLVMHAHDAYQKALELEPSSLDAKTGLGSAIVSGAGAPMQGIALLQEVVREDPKNVRANMKLGLFSMQSRQFDRAIERFKTVVDQEPSAEAWFYLATSYENIGLKADAVKAFQQSKLIAADPSLSQFIDRKVEELSK